MKNIIPFIAGNWNIKIQR